MPQSPSGPVRPFPRGAILAACATGMMALSFATAGPAVCLSAIAADLGMDLAGRGVFLSAASWGFVAAILVSGPLADRVGFRPLLIVASLLQAGGLAVIGQADRPAGAFAGGFLLGVGSGIADALLTPVTCALYPERRTRATNLLHAFYPIGLVITIGVILLVLRWDWSWRAVFVVLAVAALPYGLAMALLPLPRQSHQGEHRLRTRQFFRRGAFVLFLVGMFLGAVTEIGPSNWLPNYIEQTPGGTRLAGGLGLMLFGVAMAAGRLGGSVLVHRLGPARLLVIGGCICAVGLLLAAAPLGAIGADFWPLGTIWATFWLAMLGLGVAAFWPTLMGCAGDRFPRAGASMFSLLAAAGSCGGIVGPMAIGFIASWVGLPAAMAAIAVAPLLAIAAALAALRSPGDHSSSRA